MTHFGTAMAVEPIRDVTPFGDRVIVANHTVLVVRNQDANNEFLESVCAFLEIGLEFCDEGDDLAKLLNRFRPIGVIADLENDFQDGYHVMKVVSDYDRTLPTMLLTSNDPVLLGAVDAVREIWGLTWVATWGGGPSPGPLVDFICHAARAAGMNRLMRT